MEEQSAVDLIDSGRCSASCLFAAGPSRGCGCSCGEQYHGALRAVDPRLPKPQGGWWTAQSVLPDYMATVLINPSLHQQHAWYKARQADGGPAAWIVNYDRNRWHAICEIPRYCEPMGTEADRVAGQLLHATAQRVLRDGSRDRTIFSSKGPRSYDISGLPNREMAIVVAQALVECWFDNLDGATILIASANGDEFADTPSGRVHIADMVRA